MTRLKKDFKRIDDTLDKLKKENQGEEDQNRGNWSRKDVTLRLNVQSYDQEITQNEETVFKMQADLEETDADLNQVREEYELLREEARKREEIAAILEAKN